MLAPLARGPGAAVYSVFHEVDAGVWQAGRNDIGDRNGHDHIVAEDRSIADEIGHRRVEIYKEEVRLACVIPGYLTLKEISDLLAG